MSPSHQNFLVLCVPFLAWLMILAYPTPVPPSRNYAEVAAVLGCASGWGGGVNIWDGSMELRGVSFSGCSGTNAGNEVYDFPGPLTCVAGCPELGTYLPGGECAEPASTDCQTFDETLSEWVACPEPCSASCTTCAVCPADYYNGDITRTFPVSGKFSPEQKALYEVVLAAQYAAIDAVKPDNHWNQPHEAALRVLTQGLIDLGLLAGTLDDALANESYKPFFMHRTGHWLGLDVHDVGDYKVGDAWRQLEPGMVMTVEPGIYISPDDDSVPRKWRGIGVRIEDDVVVTKTGYEVLTAKVPKDPDEIEALMAAARQAEAEPA